MRYGKDNHIGNMRYSKDSHIKNMMHSKNNNTGNMIYTKDNLYGNVRQEQLYWEHEVWQGRSYCSKPGFWCQEILTLTFSILHLVEMFCNGRWELYEYLTI